jgi:hypothetical protein
MAAQQLHLTSVDPAMIEQIEATKQRERALSRMLVTYICTGLAFRASPGLFEKIPPVPSLRWLCGGHQGRASTYPGI